MLGKIWKKVLLLIVLIACLFNIVNKLVKKPSLKTELLSSAQYMEEIKEKENKNQ